MEIKDIKDKIEKAIIAIATVNQEGEPHNIVIAHAKVEEHKIIITDNYMKTTIENIKNNSNVSLVFWDEEKGWRINGRAEYYKDGEWFELVKSLETNKNHPCKGAIVINTEEVVELG